MEANWASCTQPEQQTPGSLRRGGTGEHKGRTARLSRKAENSRGNCSRRQRGEAGPQSGYASPGPRRAEQKQRDTQGRYRTDYGPGSLMDADAVSTTQVKTTMHHDWAGLTQHARPAGHPMLAPSTGRRKITDRTVSTHSEKAFNKVQCPFVMKILSELRRGCVNLIKNTHKIPTNSHHLRGEKVEAFLVRSGTRPWCPPHHCFLAARCTYLLLRWLCSETRKIKHTQIGKEDVKLPLCTDDTINIETLKESRKTNQPSSNKPLQQRYGVKVLTVCYHAMYRSQLLSCTSATDKHNLK